MALKSRSQPWNIPSGAKNLISLALIQGGNALIPLLMFPYLLSKIGADNFAKLAALEAASFIILVVGLYSFDISGLNLVHKRLTFGGGALARSYYSILYARLILLFPCACLFMILVINIDESLTKAALVWLLFPLGMVLQSSYYYQATSNNFPLALFVLIPRFSACAFAFMCVDAATSTTMASAYISLSYLATGAASIIYLHTQLGFINPVKIKRQILILIYQGRSLFVGGLSVLIYRGSNILLLTGLDASPTAVSTYAIAEKYIKMIQAITLPVTQIFSVKLIKSLNDKNRKNYGLFATLWANTKHQVVLSISIAIGIVCFCMFAYNEILFDIPKKSISLLLIMIPATIFGVVNYMYGAIALSSMKLESAYAKILLYCGFIAITLSIAAINLFGEVGAAYSYVVAEFIITITIFYTLHKIK